LKPRTSIASFLSSLKDQGIIPLIKAKPLRWVILPQTLSTVPLLGHNIHWDLLLILPGNTAFPPGVQSQIAAEWTVSAGVPSRLLKDFDKKNEQLLNDLVKPPDDSGHCKASSSQSLELSPELDAWISNLPAKARTHPISMLNLLAFNPGKKGDYLKYGQAFGARIGSRHGVRNIDRTSIDLRYVQGLSLFLKQTRS
jgi:hypothetical protein